MNKKNKKHIESKIFHIVTVLIIILFILLITLGIFIQMFSKNEKNKKTNEVIERDAEYVRPEKIHLMDQEKFFKNYSGIVKEEKVIDIITNYIYYLIDNKKDIENIEDSNKEYINNKQKLENMGIISNYEYGKIVNIIKNMNPEKLELSYAEFDMGTLNESLNNISIDLRIKFVDIDNVMRVKMDISKSNNTDNLITFSVYE